VQFEWDENKYKLNIKKHRITFEQAIHAFFDPMRQEYYDDKHSSLGEDRYILFGHAINCILVVSFTEPESEKFRIISARKANKIEEEEFYYGNS